MIWKLQEWLPIGFMTILLTLPSTRIWCEMHDSSGAEFLDTKIITPPALLRPLEKLQTNQWVLLVNLRCLSTRVEDPLTSCIQKMLKLFMCFSKRETFLLKTAGFLQQNDLAFQVPQAKLDLAPEGAVGKSALNTPLHRVCRVSDQSHKIDSLSILSSATVL